jgi:hypothetical protein
MRDQRSRPIESIVEEAHHLGHAASRSLSNLPKHHGLGRDSMVSPAAGLLRALAQVEGIAWIASYAYP